MFHEQIVLSSTLNPNLLFTHVFPSQKLETQGVILNPLLFISQPPPDPPKFTFSLYNPNTISFDEVRSYSSLYFITFITYFQSHSPPKPSLHGYQKDISKKESDITIQFRNFQQLTTGFWIKYKLLGMALKFLKSVLT